MVVLSAGSGATVTAITGFRSAMHVAATAPPVRGKPIRMQPLLIMPVHCSMWYRRQWPCQHSQVQ